MRVTVTSPCRICLFGGGTDVEPFSKVFGGEVVNFTINKTTTVEISDDGLGATRRNYSGGGLGGSGSFWTAFVAAQMVYSECEKIDLDDIAEKAYQIETNVFKWHGGRQDQYAAVHGGFNRFHFNENGVTKDSYSDDIIREFVDWLVLARIKGDRKSANIQQGFLKLNRTQTTALMDIKELVDEAEELFLKRDFKSVGKLFDIDWKLKKLSNKVSNEYIDSIYSDIMKQGALGGKIVGAGQGGHFMFAVEPDKKKEVSRYCRSIGIDVVNFKYRKSGLQVKIE